MRVSALVALPFLFCASSEAQITYVDSTATGGQTGASWQDAYVDLQAALAVTQQGEIWVAGGTYYPGVAGNQTATFQLKNNLTLFGGFQGVETSLGQRDIFANPTVLSGDIDQNDTYGSGLNWWQYQWSGSQGNSFHIVTGSGTDASAVLDGFVLFAGVAADPNLRGGGGLVVDSGSPTIRNCEITHSALGYGSSAWLGNCDSIFENCVIRDGYTCNCGSGGWTSGIVCDDGSNVTFVDCDFINHYYVSSQSQGRGAALNIAIGCTGDLLRCRFIGNQTGNFYPIGGGTAYGAGVFAQGDVVADQCEFIDNFAHAGAGMTVWKNATITNCLFARNEAVPHPNGAGFEDGNYGAGLLALGSGQLTVKGCTFVDNNCEKGAGLALYGTNDATIRNTIIYDNYANPPLPGEDSVWILKQQITGKYDIAYSCVEGLLQQEPGEDAPDPSKFPGCFDVDPGLASVANHDYSLAPTSKCVDAGSNPEAQGMTVDLAGNPRFQDAPNIVDTGVGAAPVVDIGAFEYGPNSPWLDLGHALAGVNGLPTLDGTGSLQPNSPLTITLGNAAAAAPAFLVVGLAEIDSPFLGGVLVPDPLFLITGLQTNGGGGVVIPTAWPSGVPTGLSFFMQIWVADGAAVFGHAASNGLSATAP